MTRRLILTRHAKSSWDDASCPDHDRTLNDRGRAAATELGAWLASRGYVPDQVLCSDAARTRETWDRVRATLDTPTDADLKPALYNAGPDTLLAVLRHAAGDTAMIVGHNPGIGEFAQRIVARAPVNPDFRHFPTGATLVADFTDDDWGTVAYATGACLDFFVPKDVDA